MVFLLPRTARSANLNLILNILETLLRQVFAEERQSANKDVLNVPIWSNKIRFFRDASKKSTNPVLVEEILKQRRIRSLILTTDK